MAPKAHPKAKAKAKALAGPPPYVGIRRTAEQLYVRIENLNRDLVASGQSRLMEHPLQAFRRTALGIDDLVGVQASASRFLRSRDLFVRGLIRNGRPAATVACWGAPPGVTRIWVDSAFADSCQADWDGMLLAAGGFDAQLAQLELENIPPMAPPGAAAGENSDSDSEEEEEE
jgi:hypothetical protein